MFRLFSTIAFLSILAVNGPAQFTIKLPKIPKVDKKAERQKTDVSTQTRTNADPVRRSSGKPYHRLNIPTGRR
ncbi:MAG TPA: hypothetical protein VK612_04450 [Pyrinomonadaceae bacterium]|nr:hypothetical protein [Pyrinomonadaceae bacterium]